MNAPSFMPGPWRVEKRGASLQIQTAHRGEGSNFCVAPVNAWADNREATASLIAAAPDLYAALQEIDRTPTGGYGQLLITSTTWDLVHAALAKARGEIV